MLRGLLLGLAVLLAACSPAVDAEFSDIEVTRPDIPIPPALPMAASSVTFSFSLDSGSLGASTNPDSQDGITEVKLHRLVFTAKGSINDLSFIQTLHALACVPINKNTTQSSRQVEIADYQRVLASPASATFEVPLAEPVDLLPLLRPTKSEPRRIVVIVNLGGTMPTSEWKVDVLMSLSLRLRQ